MKQDKTDREIDLKVKPIKLPRWFKRVLKRQYKRGWKMMLRSARGLEPCSDFMIGVRVSEVKWKREMVPCWMVVQEEFDRLPLKIKKRVLPRIDLWHRHIPLVKIKKSRLPWWVELLEVVRHDLKCPKYEPIHDLLRGIEIRNEYLFVPLAKIWDEDLLKMTGGYYFDYIPEEIQDARITSPEGTCYPLSLSR